MKITLLTTAILFAVIGAPTVLRASPTDITYNIDLTVDSGSVMGTITTDGSTGDLTSSNIVNWDLALNDGSPLTSLLGPSSGNNSSISVFASTAFTATATQLLFNFSDSDNQGFLFIANGTSTAQGGGSFFCAVTAGIDNNCNGTDTPPDITVGTFAGAATSTFSAETGETVIGTVTPEPDTAVLWLTGIGLVGFVTRKRIAQGHQLAS